MVFLFMPRVRKEQMHTSQTIVGNFVLHNIDGIVTINSDIINALLMQ